MLVPVVPSRDQAKLDTLFADVMYDDSNNYFNTTTAPSNRPAPSLTISGDNERISNYKFISVAEDETGGQLIIGYFQYSIDLYQDECYAFQAVSFYPGDPVAMEFGLDCYLEARRLISQHRAIRFYALDSTPALDMYFKLAKRQKKYYINKLIASDRDKYGDYHDVYCFQIFNEMVDPYFNERAIYKKRKDDSK